MKRVLICVLVVLAAFGLRAVAGPQAASQDRVTWNHISSASGDLPIPNRGTEQTSITIGDFGHDGHPGFVLTERTAPDSVVLYRRAGSEWKRTVIEPEPLHIEAGGVAMDVDGDGNLDYIAAGDWKRNEIWWWRNPYPHLDGRWQRHTIKRAGSHKHHDQMAAEDRKSVV